MTLEQFNKKYKYQSDKERFNTSLDIWELPKDSDIIRADCESYCRFLKNNIDGFSDWDYYYCKVSGYGHCVLSNEAMIIDCNSQETMLKDKFMQRYNITELKKYSKFVIFSKYLFAKVFLFLKKGY